ncbi:DAK2 domain-containing protein [Mycoplasma sp. NEAQ87857]|uniref:DAK2 domain-containing protein n=1 Tax=Mycoplasma sp. NEAQ87857 TaxID=2683967 RepID=UPI0013198B91|nr:DAK2 domain-containing protein [Mycoplasma sp. NEAQ87857]QGZ97779.1 DAK2 domain-containing protein [Mycoplasma sp. NEAQ87857]
MHNKILDGELFAKAMISGANALTNKKNQIDALNVFPVPDGDTGTNMSSTVNSIINNLSNLEDYSIENVSAKIAHSMIYEARGNSGVILSQIFKGFALACVGKEALDVNELIEAFNSATARAYKSVFKPIEGTILTVIRETSESLATNLYNQDVSIEQFFEATLKYMRKSCDETPNKLKTLREVGVTDSGGEGLYTIFWGINQYLNNQPVELNEQEEDIANFISDKEVYEGEFGYCTEVLVDLNKPDSFDKNSFIEKMEKIANSLVVVNDDNLLKIHGHTKKPGKLLNFAQKFGEFIKIKSENMTLQANNSKANSQKLQELANGERKKCAIVSCNLGSGIIERMKELGCDYVVESGQTQNPSAQDLIKAFQSVNAENIFVLPNNSNVILVAQQAAQVFTDSNIIVIPTKTQVQGMTAILNFNDSTDPELNHEMMLDSIEEVISGEITQAVRNTKINNIKISKKDYLGILNGKIITSQKDIIKTAKTLLEQMIDSSKEIVSLYYGDDESYSTAAEIANYITSKYDIEVEIIEGNQPNYNFLIGVE